MTFWKVSITKIIYAWNVNVLTISEAPLNINMLYSWKFWVLWNLFGMPVAVIFSLVIIFIYLFFNGYIIM